MKSWSIHVNKNSHILSKIYDMKIETPLHPFTLEATKNKIMNNKQERYYNSYFSMHQLITSISSLQLAVTLLRKLLRRWQARDLCKWIYVHKCLAPVSSTLKETTAAQTASSRFLNAFCSRFWEAATCPDRFDWALWSIQTQSKMWPKILSRHQQFEIIPNT